MATAPLRALPDFLIIGTQKGGTTSLFSQIMMHPGICGFTGKEVHFFDDSENFRKGVLWYRSHFPTILKKHFHGRPLKQPLLIGEATPYYLIHPHTPSRAAKLLPRAKFIVMLRNPIDRAFSHYQHEVSKGRETLPFEQAIQSREEELTREMDKMMKDENYYSYFHRHYSYLSRGIYWEQLERWFAHFHEKQFLVIKSEDYFEDPMKASRRITAFLGLPPHELKIIKKHNIGTYTSAISKEMMDFLAEYYKPHNQRLYKLLNHDLGW